jgi:hypothetical protein
MQVLRVETFSKVGAYMSGAASRQNINWQNHPTPSGDNLLHDIWYDLAPTDPWYFGFKDMDQLLNWWPTTSWHAFFSYNARKHGNADAQVGISTYDVDSIDLHIGETQVIFVLDRAQRIHFKPFSRVHNIQEQIINAIPCL